MEQKIVLPCLVLQSDNYPVSRSLLFPLFSTLFTFSTVSSLLLLYNYIIILLFVPCLDVFDNYMQQDAHEFFNYLLNTIGDLLQGT